VNRARTIILFIAAAFLIIGVHQTIIYGFEISYWIFMVSLSMYFLSRLIGQKEEKKKEKVKSSKRPQGNRQSKRLMKRTR